MYTYALTPNFHNHSHHHQDVSKNHLPPSSSQNTLHHRPCLAPFWAVGLLGMHWRKQSCAANMGRFSRQRFCGVVSFMSTISASKAKPARGFWQASSRPLNHLRSACTWSRSTTCAASTSSYSFIIWHRHGAPRTRCTSRHKARCGAQSGRRLRNAKCKLVMALV